LTNATVAFSTLPVEDRTVNSTALEPGKYCGQT